MEGAAARAGSARTWSISSWLPATATQSGSTIAVQVADSGIGIAQDELPRIVKKFVRGRGAPGAGSGLGLAIAARIARDHHGTLHIDSHVGVGTTVTVTLPAA